MSFSMHACIDLGSNSFHLLIGEWQAGEIRIVERLSEKVQLGEDVAITGRISDAAFRRGKDCLQRFKVLIDQYTLRHCWAVGTNTFRIAANADLFVDQAREIGIEISVISGLEEAMLIYAGVISGLPKVKSKRLVIDIGGGSTEVILGRQQERFLTESLAIGSVAWRDRFFANPKADTAQIIVSMKQAKTTARKIFNAVAPGFKRIGWEDVFASSGTVKMLANMSQGMGFPEAAISSAALDALQLPIAKAIADGTELSGLKQSRRDLALAGWSVLAGLLEAYEIHNLHYSNTALREGMLDFMVRSQETMPQDFPASGLPYIDSPEDE
ncbi:MAG: hypothetical protein OXD01_09930 [Gammaproteobacteria bacterium]|nr:hypothetical protein [Gammaproteobacteria bacterium]